MSDSTDGSTRRALLFVDGPPGPGVPLGDRVPVRVNGIRRRYRSERDVVQVSRDGDGWVNGVLVTGDHEHSQSDEGDPLEVPVDAIEAYHRRQEHLLDDLQVVHLVRSEDRSRDLDELLDWAEAQGPVFEADLLYSTRAGDGETLFDRPDGSGGGEAGVHRLRTVESVDRESFQRYRLQVHPSTAEEIGPLGPEGELTIRNTNIQELPEIHAKVETRSSVPRDAVGIDYSLRHAIGLRQGDRVELDTPPLPGPLPRHRLFDRVLGIRTEVCRVRFAVHPDVENGVCRVPSDTMTLLGLEPGDQVVLETPWARVRGVRALAITSDLRERIELQESRLEGRSREIPGINPSCFEKMNLGRIQEAEADIPQIFLEAQLRAELGIGAKRDGGVCHPVKIYRDTGPLFARHIHDLIVPVMLGVVAAVFALPLSAVHRLGIVLGAVAIAIFSVIYVGRRDIA